MSELKEKLAKVKEAAVSQLESCGVSNIDHELLDTLVGRLRLLVNNRDAMHVAGSDPKELETVRKNFVVKKLEIDDKEKGAAAVKAVAEKMKSVKMKNRAAFYYMVAKELG